MNEIQTSDIKNNNCKKAEFYIKKYLGEIAIHFNLEMWEIKKILSNIIQKNNNTKKWWDFLFKKE